MAVQLDHFIVPCRDQVASAQLLAGLRWNVPDSHQREVHTVSYVRQAQQFEAPAPCG